MKCLGTMWLKGPKGGDHQERLESFYAPQAEAYDRFRSAFLWGRKPMLAACAARVQGQRDMVWVDLGGGTAENVSMMEEFISLSHFRKIYVVDLTPSLCKVAEEKVKAKGWKNVEVVLADATAWRPKEEASLVTFSYSLSMIPGFNAAVDKATSYLKDEGLLGVADFFVSAKYDLPLRQMGWADRWFWRSIFDLDNIDLGPERRQYLDYKFSRIYEYNGRGSIPYVPLLTVPYFTWVGVKKTAADLEADIENRKERPPTFPPTFIYSLSWEDPRTDVPVLKVGKGDVVLTLTSGGCNTLELASQGAELVVSVDLNPAQTALLELKINAIKYLTYDDLWKMFGEGKHPEMEQLFEGKLAPWMSQGSQDFWRRKMYYFKSGFYYHGAMGVVLRWVYWMQVCLGMRKKVLRFCDAETLEEQVRIWDSFWFVKVFAYMPRSVYKLVQTVLAYVLLNRVVCWLGLGVPPRQYNLIDRDGREMCEYAGTTLDGAARNTRLVDDNYFYRACLSGSFSKRCCPNYLKPATYQVLKAGAVDNIVNVCDSFLTQLYARKYTRVILMDHVDWLDDGLVQELAVALREQVRKGGRIIWRSASLNPPYVPVFAKHGFKVACVHRVTDAAENGCLDRVNMYASFWYGVRQ